MKASPSGTKDSCVFKESSRRIKEEEDDDGMKHVWRDLWSVEQSMLDYVGHVSTVSFESRRSGFDKLASIRDHQVLLMRLVCCA